MKRSFQEVVELVVFGLIALLIGTGVLWLVGWVLGLVGLLMKFLAGLIWWLLRYIVPIAIVAGLIYFLVRVLQGDRSRQAAPASAGAPTGAETAPAPTAPASAGQTAGTGPATAPSASGDAAGATDAEATEAADQAATHGLPEEGAADSADEPPAADNEDDSKHN